MEFVRSGEFILLIIVLIIIVALWKRDRNIVTMLWIFGTFAGIVAWLYGFDTSNMSRSILILIDGLKTAFMTSIAWLVTAIWISVVEHHRSEDEEVDTMEAMLWELKQMNEKLNAILAFKENQESSNQLKEEKNGEVEQWYQNNTEA